MSQLSLVLSLVGIFLNGSGAVKVEILEPIRETGDQVALIFPSGGHIDGEQYRKTAQAIQEASELRVWAAFTGQHFMRSGLTPVATAMRDAIKALEEAGMTSDNYIGVGHGEGGRFLPLYASDSNLKAIILMGIPLDRDTQLLDFPVPVLTLAAELDGVSRITRMAEEFAKLNDDVAFSFQPLYRTPVILLNGTNHAQFASGNMPALVANNDLKPNVTEEDAHRVIGEHVSNFITATFSSSPALVEDAREELRKSFYKSFEKIQPFLTVKALDVSGNVSQWTIMTQEYIAGDLADQIKVVNEAGQNPWFRYSNPSITRDGDDVVVETTSLLSFNPNTGANVVRESAVEINMKLMSRDAIWEALTVQDDGKHLGGPDTSLRGKPITCKSLNELALEVALKHSSQEAQDRYKTQGRPIIFKEDSVSIALFLWTLTPLTWWEDTTGLHVQPIAYSTSLNSRSNPGVLYCKMLSVYRAMEWINIDSLQKYGPWG